jgi:hypothetical protein
MKATRERIDRKLDRLQARATASSWLIKGVAFVGGVLISTVYVWSKRRQARRKRAHASRI